MATHSSILNWEIPRTELLGGLETTESQRGRHDLVTKRGHADFGLINYSVFCFFNASLLLPLFAFSGCLKFSPPYYQCFFGPAVLKAGTPKSPVMHCSGVRVLQSLPIGGRWKSMVARVEGAGVEKQWAKTAVTV